MALDYATNSVERAAVALIAGPGARLTGRYGGRAQVPGTTSRPFHPGIDIAGAGVGAKVTMFTPRSFPSVWYSSKDEHGALDLFLGTKADGLRFVHNDRNLHTKGKVAAGTTVAVMGMTGNVNGVHVHLERYEGGVPVDPLPWLISQLRGTGSTGDKTDAPSTGGAEPATPSIRRSPTMLFVGINTAGHVENGRVYFVAPGKQQKWIETQEHLKLALDTFETNHGYRPTVRYMSASEAYRVFDIYAGK